MSEVVNRDELERRLARAVGKEQRAELEKLLAYLGNPPRLEAVPQSYWENGWKNMAAVIEPILLDIYLEQAEASIANSVIGVSWDLVNKRAADWARQYTYDLVHNLDRNTRQGLQATISAFYEDGLTLGELESRLSRWFSPVRSEMIAVTETTRAATESEKQIADLIYSESGVRMIPVWQTANDELVCPVCGPKHDQPIVDGEYPPAHPRCRCWTVHEYPKVAK